MRRIALFAHYDAGGRIRPFILHFLRELRALCDEVVFVSTATLDEAALASVRPYCARAFTRENVGFDFAMWQHAMKDVDLDAWDELVLTNSSVFGPLWPLARAFDAMAGRPCDAWSMTDNVEIDWHLQSWFLVFRTNVLRAPVFRRFWDGVLPYKDKHQVIRSYEVGLSRLLLDYGFRLEAMAKLDAIPLARRIPPIGVLPHLSLAWRMATRRANATNSYPLGVIRAGVPFVKVELLRDNPLSQDLPSVLDAMAESGFDMNFLEFDRPFKPDERLKRGGLDEQALARARTLTRR